MTFTDWINDTKRRYREQPVSKATRVSTSELAIGAGRRLGQVWNYGRNVWDHEWDVLIILDACRYDLFCEVVDEYDYLPNSPEYTYSPASMSREWMNHHFSEEYADELKRTGLLSGNVFTQEDWITPDKFAHLDEVWQHSWDDDLGTIPARAVTDATIDFWRNRRRDVGADRAIAWYLQPHNPFIGADWSDGWTSDIIGNWDEHGESVWQQLKKGEITLKQLWPAYRNNLRYALDDVELLLQNLDADRVVITSDHANCIGEFGIYGHPPYIPHPALKRVPWVELSATDEQTYTPNYAPDEFEVDDSTVADRLRDLGYTE